MTVEFLLIGSLASASKEAVGKLLKRARKGSKAKGQQEDDILVEVSKFKVKLCFFFFMFRAFSEWKRVAFSVLVFWISIIPFLDNQVELFVEKLFWP